MAVHAEAPARILKTHVRDRFVDEDIREPSGFRNRDWPIEVAWDKGRLSDAPARLQSGKIVNDMAGKRRWVAMEEYDRMHSIALCRSGRDSTSMDVVATAMRTPLTEAMELAARQLVSVESHMSRKDRQIVRKLCEGYTLPQAVKWACGDDFTDTVAARVRDALDALDEAISTAREGGFRYVRMT